jgi:hypothetical protein
VFTDTLRIPYIITNMVKLRNFRVISDKFNADNNLYITDMSSTTKRILHLIISLPAYSTAKRPIIKFFFIYIILWVRMRLSPLGTSATIFAYCTSPAGHITMKHLVEWELAEITEVLGENLHQCRVAAVGSRRRTARAMTRPQLLSMSKRRKQTDKHKHTNK